MEFLSYLMVLIRVSSQSFENPAMNSTISCGLTETCNIICNSANACQAAEFYLYSNDAYVECSGVSSCTSLKIISVNATSFTLYINGYNAFLYGIASIQQPNQHLMIRCVKELSCQESSFYYNGIGSTVDHICTHNGSCDSSLISALPADAIHLRCDAVSACNNLDIYTPMNRHNTSVIHIHSIAKSAHIYSMHGLYNLNITCIESCAHSNPVYIIYGKEYQTYCSMDDVSCMRSADIQSVAFRDHSVVIVYNNDANALDLKHTETVLFMLYSHIEATSNIITSGALSSYLHVVCVDQIHYPSCDNIYFNFSLSNDVVINANNAHSMRPNNDFTRVAYRDNNHENQYYLHTTSSISLQCNQLQGGQCLYNSVLYTESPANLRILCGADDCHYSDIYTTIDPTQSTSAIHIICHPSNTSCDAQFLLHFANNLTCHTPNDPICVAFLSSSPTSNPISSSLSPTLYPSHRPSLSPSLPPSMHPTLTPTLSPVTRPTSMPSHSPTFAPSPSPTIPPTHIPTFAPSNSPTMPPTNHPTLYPSLHPTVAPSISPTHDPTFSPSMHPTLAPSNVPTRHPTFSPTIAPSASPTTPPSNAPTMPPTKTPSTAPTVPPTHAPTTDPSFSPTHAPTRHPTQDIYTQTIYIDYILNNITHNISTQLYDPKTQSELEHLFENCYLLTSQALIQDKNQTLHYKDFHLVIVEVQTHPYSPPNTETNTLQHIPRINHTGVLKANIHYADAFIGDTIRFISRRLFFQNRTQYKLRTYFNYYHLQLIVGDPWEAGDEHVGKRVVVDWFFIFISVIGFVCMVIGIASFIYNNWEASAWTDNASSISIPLFGLQMVDCFTDINLCVEMFLHFEESEEDRVAANRGSPVLLWIAAWGALTFTVIPYITNLVLAAGIKNVKEIKENPFAKSYFQTTSWFFIVLVVFCGAVYPALSVVSSRLFAFEFLNSGLTMMELTQLTRWRLHLTIFLENIPQLFCSVIFILYLGTPTNDTILAMIVSGLQIVATVTNYIVTYRPSDCRAIEYDLQVEVRPDFEDQIKRSQRSLKSKESLKSITGFTQTSSCMDINDIGTEEEEDSDDEEEYEAAINRTYLETTPSTLNKEQKTQIRRRKERKSSLRRCICTELSLRLNAIEIGYVTLTPNGCIIHIIHYTFESEAKAFHDAKLQKRLRFAKSMESDELDLGPFAEQAMLMSPSSLVLGSPRKSDGHDRWEGDSRSFERTAKSLFKDLYKRKSDQVECALSSHFGFKQELISVTYHKRYAYTPWEMRHRDRFTRRDLSCAKYHPISQLSIKHDSDHIEISAVPTRAVPSLLSPTDEMQKSTNQILHTLMPKIREKLMQNDKDTVKSELLEEGYNETLIDRVFEMGELLAGMTGMNGVNDDTLKQGPGEEEDTLQEDKAEAGVEEKKADNENENENGNKNENENENEIENQSENENENENKNENENENKNENENENKNKNQNENENENKNGNENENEIQDQIPKKVDIKQITEQNQDMKENVEKTAQINEQKAIDAAVPEAGHAQHPK